MKVTFYKGCEPNAILWRGNIKDIFIPRVDEYVCFSDDEALGLVDEVIWRIHNDSVDILVRYP